LSAHLNTILWGNMRVW